MNTETDYVIICDSQVCLKAFLSEEEPAQKSSQSKIKVVGIISDIQDLEPVWGGESYTGPHLIMDTAYLVTD